jgi:hypothetical protein
MARADDVPQGLALKARNAMLRAGVTAEWQIQYLSDDVLLEVKEFGVTCLALVRQVYGEPIYPDDLFTHLPGKPASWSVKYRAVVPAPRTPRRRRSPVRQPVWGQRNPYADRNREIQRMREKGATYAAIARRFGLTRARIAQICSRAV